MNIEDKIIVLNHAKKLYREENLNTYGICVSISDSIRDFKGLDRSHEFPNGMNDIYSLIPEAKFDHINKLASKYKFKKPKEWANKSTCFTNYWWDLSDSDNRIKALNAIIKELKKEKSNE